MKLFCYLAFPILFGISAVSTPLILVLLTDNWIFCVPYLRIFSIQSALSILNTVNLQVIKGIGKSDVLLKLEFIKKPIYLIIILVAMFVSPLAIAIGNLLYNIIALFINIYANKKLLNYSLKEQMQDFFPPLLLSIMMALLTFLITLLKLNVLLMLFLQVLFGVLFYITFSYIFKMDSFEYIILTLKEKINKFR